MITGIAGSDVKVSCNVVVVVAPPSVIDKPTEKLPSALGVPLITPSAELKVRPGGKPVTFTVAAGLAPVDTSWKLNGLFVLAVALVLLMKTGSAGGGAL